MTQGAVSSFLYLALKTLSINVKKCGAVVECQIVTLKDRGSRPTPVMLLLKLSSSVEVVRHFKSLSKKFDIYSKIVCRDVENIFRHQSELVLRHQMQVSNYFVKFFYSVAYSAVVRWYIYAVTMPFMEKLFFSLTISMALCPITCFLCGHVLYDLYYFWYMCSMTSVLYGLYIL